MRQLRCIYFVVSQFFRTFAEERWSGAGEVIMPSTFINVCARDGFAEGCEGAADATGLSCLRASDDGLRGCGLRLLRYRVAEVY